MLLDFETQNLPNFKLRARDSRQPHIVSVAAIICDDTGKTFESYEAISKPDGWTIPKEVEAIHGISTEHALKVGIPEKEICAKLLDMILRTQLLVAYNATFDRFIQRIAMRRFDLMQDSDDEWWRTLPTYCAMKPMIDVCQLPGKRRGQWKYPKLQESYKHAFGKEFVGAHNAMDDLKATKDLYFWIRNNIPDAVAKK